MEIYSTIFLGAWVVFMFFLGYTVLGIGQRVEDMYRELEKE